MSRFLNSETGVVVIVDDSKDERFASPLWEAQAEDKKPARRAKSDDTK